MNSNQQRDTDEIRIADMLHMVWKYRKLVLMTSLVGLILGIVLSVISYLRGEMSKQYTIKTSIAVTSRTEDGLFTTQSINPNSADIHLAEDMVDSVIFVIRSDRTLEEAIQKLELVGITAKDLYNNLQLTQYKNTQIVDISLYWRNAEEGVRILDAINEVCPGILMELLRIGDVAVVNYPTAKYIIGGSVNASMWLLMMAAGMACGMGIAVLMLFVRPTLINVEDVGELLGLKVLGKIPQNKVFFQNKKQAFQDPAEQGLGVVQDHYCAAAQSLFHLLREEDKKIFYVTSACRNEGKTSVAASLALRLANLEKKVLLLDMDVNAPGIGKLFQEDVNYEHSINAVFRGDAEFETAVDPFIGYLDILPAIIDSKEPIFSDMMLKLLKEKADLYDYVIIDTSSVGEMAEVLNLNRIADGALMVIQYDTVPVKQLQEALQRLKDSGIPVLGCIINQWQRGLL